MSYRGVLTPTTALAAALVAAPVHGGAQTPDTAARDTLDLTRFAVVSGVVSGTGPDDPLPDALVYVQGQPVSAVTDSLGRYALPVPPGLWMITVFHERAAEMELSRPPTSLVTAERGRSIRVDFSLSPELGSQERPFALDAMDISDAAKKAFFEDNARKLFKIA